MKKNKNLPHDYVAVLDAEDELANFLLSWFDAVSEKIIRLPWLLHRGRRVTLKSADFSLDEVLDTEFLKEGVKDILFRAYGAGVMGVESELGLDEIFMPPQFFGVALGDVLDKVKDFSKELKDVLRDEFSTGWGEGEGVTGLVKRFEDVLGGAFGRSRLECIARTETHSVYNRSRFLAASSTGVFLRKRWRAFFDSRTGSDSKELNGVVVGFNDFFVDNVGRSVLYPPNRPNCRCRVEFLPE